MTEQGRLTFFRVMAFAVGVGLLILVLSMVLKYVFEIHVLDWWAMPHGFLYMVYLASVLLLGLALHWEPVRIVLVMLAGVVPFLSFWVEHRVTVQARAQLAGADTLTR